MPFEQIPERQTPTQRQPSLGQMIHPVMQEVTALAERTQVAQPVAGGIVIQMSCSQRHFSLARL